ncbi:MAG: DUF3363 domain-containing protein [Burkholderia sp.]
MAKQRNYLDEEGSLRVKAKARQPKSDSRQVASVMGRLRREMKTGGKNYKPRAASASGAASAPPARMQRVAVRVTYAKNKGDGQWAAHGRYIARESASIENDLDQQTEVQHETSAIPELAERSINPLAKEAEDARYHDIPVSDPGRIAALRQSYLAELARKPQAETLNRVRSLSSIDMVFDSKRNQVLLPGNASVHVDHGRAERDDALRRRSDGESRTGATAGRKRRLGAPGFGSAGDAVPIADTLDRWQKAGDGHLFKLIVSPEFGERMDLKKHTRDLVAQMEKNMGTRLEWVAAVHTNTDNPHVHLTVRGIDERGQELRMPKQYIKNDIRQHASRLATNELGYRTDLDIAEAKARQITQHRFTDLDRGLLKKAVDNVVTFKSPTSPREVESQATDIRRLQQLEKMGLAQRVEASSWRLNPALESALREAQKSHDRLKAMHSHRELITDRAAPLVFTDLKTPGQRIEGRIVGTGLNEDNNQSYLMMEGIDGKLHYLMQSKAIEKQRSQGQLLVGSYASIEVAQAQKDGKSFTYLKVDNHGSAIGNDWLDHKAKELVASGSKPVKRPQTSDTLATHFRHDLADRLDLLVKRGALSLGNDGQVVLASPLAFDAIQFQDKGMPTARLQLANMDAFVGTVTAKGDASVALVTHDGICVQVSNDDLEKLGSAAKYLKDGQHVFVGMSHEGKPFVTVLRQTDLETMVAEEKINRLDQLVRQVPDLPENHALRDTVDRRRGEWAKREISMDDPKFNVKANSWRKGMDMEREAQEHGFAKALDTLAKQKNKPVSDLPLESGRQVTGRVVLVHRDADHTSIVIEGSQQLTVIRQPNPLDKDVASGKRMRARAIEEQESAKGQTQLRWRFADLEREEAKTLSKGAAKKLF